MGVRSHVAAPLRRARPAGPGKGATVLVVLVALVLLLANGRPVGTADASGVGGWLLRGGLGLAGLAFQLDPTGEALVGKALAALLAALAAGALFAAVVRRHGLSDARWAAWLLALGTTLAAAAQAWTGEAAAACAVAVAVLLLVRSEAEEDPGPAARAGLPLGLAVALEPTTVALAVVLVGAVLVRWRHRGLLALAWAAPGALLAVATLGVAAPRPTSAMGPLPGLALLASPAKGALVFAPVALVGIVGLLRALRSPARRLWDQPQPGRFLPIASGLAVVAHFACLAVVGGWAAGDFWGPRLVAPAWPLLLLFLPEGFAGLGVGASLLAIASVAIQALGAVTYDGRWDRLHRGAAGDRATWEVETSPIPFEARERVARVARPGLQGRRLVVHERVMAPSGASGSFLSFAKTEPAPTGVDATMSTVRFEAGAHTVAGHLELLAPGDGLAFRVPEGARPRHLEIRIVGRGAGTLGLGESDFGKETRWRERAVSGSFRLKLPYFHADSGGPDLRLTLRSGGPIAIESVAVVPPTEPEDVLRLP
jgi:hypothetical protein